MQVNIKNLIDEAQCYRTVCELRWPDGVECPACESKNAMKRGLNDTGVIALFQSLYPGHAH